MLLKFKLASNWHSFLSFHKQNIWERFEPLWFSLIAITIVTVLAFGLRTAISYQAKVSENLYISPSSYSTETDFFNATNSEEIAFDPFIIPSALAINNEDRINVLIK